MNSQVQIFSNLMLDDKEHKPHYKWMPGDLVAEIYKEFLNPPELMHRHLTPQQAARIPSVPPMSLMRKSLRRNMR